MIGEHANDIRDDEAAAEYTDGERCRDGPIFREQFVETFCLTGVVAEDDRVQAIALQTTENTQVTRDRFRCAQRLT